MEKKRFIGPNEVFGVTILEDRKTPAGKEIVKVMYEGEKIPADIMPMITFEALITDETKDWNYVREKRLENLLKELTKICLEYDVVYSDISHLTTELKKKLEAAFDRATNFLWTGDDAQFIPGYPALALRTLLDAEKVLTSITNEPKSETNGK